MNNNAQVSSFRRHPVRPIAAFALGVLALGPACAQVSISDAPLSVSSSIDPNILFLLDDSGSMMWETMPDDVTARFGGNINGDYVMWVFPRVAGLHGGSDYTNTRVVRFSGDAAAYFRSSHNNTLYYNPAVTYKPWVDADGNPMAAASPGAAPNRPLFSGAGMRNLTADNTVTTNWLNTDGSHTNESQTFYPAVYYHYNGSGSVTSEASYTRVEIRSSSASYTGHGRENRSECTAGTCTYAQEIQNFANWYTYYRSRVFAARSGIGKAFTRLPENVRVGFGRINKGTSTIDGVTTGAVVTGVRPFGTGRDDFYDNLYEGVISTNGTPLRQALNYAGQYFRRTDDQGPWGGQPGTSDSTPHLECRQSYSILMTDGYWNVGDGAATTSAARANVDGTDGPSHTGPEGASFTYDAESPFFDGHSNTLADVAAYYWKNDLRTDLDNRVPTSAINPAFWQHMVTFGVGLGVTGSIDPDAAFEAINTGAAINWPDPHVAANNFARLDDLLHASVNGRGGFFSAADPDTFANKLGDVLDSIVSRTTGHGTSAAASAAILQSSTLLYTAGFRSTDWSGTLRGEKPVAPSGGWSAANCSAPYAIRTIQATSGPLVKCIRWDAEEVLASTAPASRNIFTRNSDSGAAVALRYSNLGTAQKAALDLNLSNGPDGLGTQRIDWLRGENPAHATFRSRLVAGDLRRLGDIVNSSPQYVGKRNYAYDLLPDAEGSSYRTFRASSDYQDRPDMIYVGANDGMLHGFDAETGAERLAYVPSTLLLGTSAGTHAQINRLMDPAYGHHYFVDGTAIVSDAYTSTPSDSTVKWRTVLVGTMGAGGRTVFALDVTDPEAFGAGQVMWEISDATDPDIGFGITRPQIVRMRNGDWAALFGNGYNSASHRAVLFVVRLSDGAVLAKIDTGQGAAGTPNGLATPTVIDWPESDLTASTIYAGDLLGNMWRFDVSNGNPTTWDNTGNRKIIFTARDPGNNRQPITAAPAVATNPKDPDSLIVTFGTGSYFKVGDSSSTQVQTIYGLIDNNTTISGRSALQQQTITSQESVTVAGQTYILRELSDETVESPERGWYLDLIVSGDRLGERVISQPSFPSGTIQRRVRVSTLIPNSDPCAPSVGGFLMDIDLTTGGRYAKDATAAASGGSAVFDLNGDGSFDADDKPGSWSEHASGISTGTGEPITVIRDGDKDLIFTGEGGDGGGGGGGDPDDPDDPPCGENQICGSNEAGPAGRQSWRQIR